jgi:RNA polymerase sigma-70 factor, ECF subfamily
MGHVLRGEVDAGADDARLIARAQAGDRDAFARLYDRHYDPIRRYLCTALRDGHDAEDAAQDVFVHAFRALPRYEVRAQPLRRWLFRIARNVAIDRARRRRSSPQDPATMEACLGGGTTEAIDAVLSAAALRTHLARLPQSQREILFLRYAAGLDPSELAALTQRTPAAVRQLHHRALVELRRRLPA